MRPNESWKNWSGCSGLDARGLVMVSPGPQLMDSMRDENIVCFAKDWAENPTSCNHVLNGLARDNQVLWLNSIASRAPKLGDRRDRRTILRKLKAFVAGARRMAPGLTVFTPLVVPLPYSPAAARLNQAVLRATVGWQRRRLGMRDFQLWTFLPTAAPLVGALGESLSVYYCTDEWSQFRSVNASRVIALERALCLKADIVFAAARSIVEKKRELNPETHLVSHGVDRDHFAKALLPDTTVPPDIARLPSPVIGFFGLIEDWIDTDLFVYLARKRPDWSIVIIGQSHIPLEHLPALPNIHWLGRKPYAELPGYAKAFSVALCPFRINELTVHVNPIKLREYLSAGLPVVSADIPECRIREDFGRVAGSHEEFPVRIEAFLREDSREARVRRSDAMREETWEKKLEEIGRHVMRVKDARRMHG